MTTLLKKYQTIIVFLLSFMVPVVILFLVFLSQNIYWNSERTILASDGFHQYVIFAQNLRNILHGSDSIFYTFTSGLGLNFYALISYYLGSFLSPLVYFFDLKSMPDAIYIFTLIKVGLIGLSTYYSLSKMYSKIIKPFILVLSTSYALMSFTISQIEINMWLDVFVLIPLILLGLNRLLNQQKFVLYYICLTLLFIQNYYFGFMATIFLTLYFLVQLQVDWSWKVIFRKTINFTIVSILSGLSSSIMLLPTFLDLSTHGEELTKITKIFTEDSWYLDFFAKNFIGAYDTTKFGAIPMISVGILPLILALVFFILKTVRWQVRLAYGVLIAFILSSFYLQPLDLLWQGMHAPNMFLHRYAWVLSTIIILLAAETLTQLDNIKLTQVFYPLGLLGLGYLLTFIFRKQYDFLTDAQFILTAIFLIAYLILLVSYCKHQLPKIIFVSFTLIFTIFEVSLNTYYQISALGSEWVFPTREGYERNLSDIDSLVKYTQESNTTFYRMERVLAQTGNDSMKYNYNGISQFSSIRNTTSSSVLDRLGFKSSGTNLNLRYQNNTILMDSLFAIKYNLSETPINKFGFDLQKTVGATSLYQNQYSAQMALLTNDVYRDVNFTVNTLDNQTNFINKITGLSEHYFYRLNSQIVTGGSLLNGRVTTNNQNTGDANITYRVSIPRDTQLYVSMPNITFTNDNREDIQITVSGRTSLYTTDNAYSFFDIGYFKAGQTIDITFVFPENSQVSFNSPNFYELNIESFQKAAEALSSQNVSVKTQGNEVITKYSATKDSSILFTLPYDKGWHASQSGKKIKISRAQGGFMKVDVQKGKGEVTLSFVPNGLKEGTILSIIGLISFVLYSRTMKRKVVRN